jgi:hypothetical protein
VGCGSLSPGGGDVFFPTWSTDGPVPAGQVTGTLVERDECLFLESGEALVLPLWEASYRYADGVLSGPDGEPLVRLGEVLHGGGGYGASWAWAERVTGRAIPERCRPQGVEPMALIYEVAPGPIPEPPPD